MQEGRSRTRGNCFHPNICLFTQPAWIGSAWQLWCRGLHTGFPAVWFQSNQNQDGTLCAQL